ncbi:MAG: ACT domain-containing protein, partial [Nitrosopumilaceae archaeon]|nr:ACT domain-containing protein [Nitrosopumilaceae archaeon]
IYDCIKMDLINYTALAVKIQPEVERQLGNAVNLNTIVVAIKRYADSFEQKEEVRDQSLLKNARLSLTDGIMDIKISTEDFGEKYPMDLLEKFSQVTNDYDLFRLPNSFRLLTEDLEDIRRIMQSIPHSQDMFHTGLVRIKITVPREDRANVGSYVVELLHKNGIEFVDAYFSQDNMIITFNQNDASKAYEILRSEIARP